MSPTPTANGLPETTRYQIIVLFSGIGTTILALMGVYLLDVYGGENIMGWYGDYVIPAGALIVGLAATSGYGLSSWLFGIKVHNRLFATIVVLQVIAYVAARYIEFLCAGPFVNTVSGAKVDFLTYFHHITMSFAWKEHGKLGEPLGAWGYGLRLLEVIGFVGGSLLVPLALRRVPYCETCQRYKKTRELALFPASVPERKIGKKDTAAQEAYQQEQELAFAKGLEHVKVLQQYIASGDVTALRTYLGVAKPHRKKTAKLPARIQVKLTHCRTCLAGDLRFVVIAGTGDQITETEQPSTALTLELVKALQSF